MESITVIVDIWSDSADRGIRLRVLDVDQAREIPLNDARFLVRITLDDRRRMHRCLIRHLASGREAFLQGGSGLSAFVRACLLQNDEQTGLANVKG